MQSRRRRAFRQCRGKFCQGYEIFAEYANERSSPAWDEDGDQGYRRKWETALSTASATGDVELPSGVDDFDDIIEEAIAAKPDAGKPLPLVFSDADLLAYTQETKYLITNALAENQPFVIGGSKKTLKTSIAADMAISLASGTRFLGRFDVPNPVSTVIVSGETGPTGLRSLRKRIGAARGDAFNKGLPLLHWSVSLPRLGNATSVRNLIQELVARKAKVLILDPAYLCLPGDRASNLFGMGDLLRSLGDPLAKLGVTMVMLHHSKKGAGDSFDLNDLAYSGFAEYFRQWLLIKRRGDYSAGTSSLRISIGGSEGHGGEFDLTIAEGTRVDERDTRKWDVKTEPVDPEKQLEEMGDKELIRDALMTGPKTMNSLRESTGKNREKLQRILDEMTANGVVLRDDTGKHQTYSLATITDFDDAE